MKRILREGEETDCLGNEKKIDRKKLFSIQHLISHKKDFVTFLVIPRNWVGGLA